MPHQLRDVKRHATGVERRQIAVHAFPTRFDLTVDDESAALQGGFAILFRERGRAAAMAVYDGVFPSLDEAVQMLFGSGSKAQRSKIRSFALVVEELGDMLSFATHLN